MVPMMVVQMMGVAEERVPDPEVGVVEEVSVLEVGVAERELILEVGVAERELLQEVGVAERESLQEVGVVEGRVQVLEVGVVVEVELDEQRVEAVRVVEGAFWEQG